MDRAREDVFREIDERRDEQDRKWGGPDHDDTHCNQDWCEYIDKFVERATAPSHSRQFEDNMIHIAALAVAAIESSRRKG